ncbi:hypothetical protein D9613_012000 [Agrocybe pediades]|uniref:Uncharacterized protein n=1 Tax=Agrocybe pediades TaxID=84607 RepID=A0A8H4VHS1_9AGAR|nr:hypothetical protein D9613_012000 [Agrocybe pediades]
MYAAPDGWMEVVQILLAQVACTDTIRGQHHWAPIQSNTRRGIPGFYVFERLHSAGIDCLKAREAKLCPSKGRKELLKYLRTPPL